MGPPPRAAAAAAEDEEDEAGVVRDSITKPLSAAPVPLAPAAAAAATSSSGMGYDTYTNDPFCGRVGPDRALWQRSEGDRIDG